MSVGVPVADPDGDPDGAPVRDPDGDPVADPEGDPDGDPVGNPDGDPVADPADNQTADQTADHAAVHALSPPKANGYFFEGIPDILALEFAGVWIIGNFGELRP